MKKILGWIILIALLELLILILSSFIAKGSELNLLEAVIGVHAIFGSIVLLIVLFAVAMKMIDDD
jgi:hypothetical protein